MANSKKININFLNKKNRETSSLLNQVLDDMNTDLYGGPTDTVVDKLTTRFNSIISNEVKQYSDKPNVGDTQSFIENLFNDSVFYNSDTSQQLSNIFGAGNDLTVLQDLFDDIYRNRLLKMNDLYEVSSQLIELREAIKVMADAIVSPDIVEGKINRTLTFKSSLSTEESNNYIAIVKGMEEKFKLQDKIKNFIVPKTLTYGEYYSYTIPYEKIFSDFMKIKQQSAFNGNMYGSYSLLEYVEHMEDTKDTNHLSNFIKESYNEFMTESMSENTSYQDPSDVIQASPTNKKNKPDKTKAFENDMKTIMENIMICNEPQPLSVLDESEESLSYYYNTFVESEYVKEHNLFKEVVNSVDGKGTYQDPNVKQTDLKMNIRDCDFHLYDPTKLIPIKIMDKTLGYYYVQSTAIDPINGVITSGLVNFNNGRSPHSRTIVDAIAGKIVKSFNKPFLEKNMKFKDLIVAALSYYNLNERRVFFQFIPVEYVQVFTVNEDENGNGTSILEGALFYAKLYLLLLLFYIMSMLLYSNDQRYNFIRTSGIDKNVRKKIEEVARARQSRSINALDLFSYTNVINKLGYGAEWYVPTGKSGEKGIETEIISGQEVLIDNEFMQMLKNSYILATGVPSAIINYLNEADFAKSIELANSRFAGRVVSNQLDFNRSITELYKKLMRYSTSIPEEIIDTFEFAFTPHKINANQIKSDQIQGFEQYKQFVLSTLIGEQEMNNPDNAGTIRELTIRLARRWFPAIDFDDIIEDFKASNIEGLDDLLKPRGKDLDDDAEDIDYNKLV